ncbi:MAG: metallophosphoesterase [Gemmatimonadetes bacterium]|nr:metallophosphoesterase [Gemmatimonadota bacterium]
MTPVFVLLFLAALAAANVAAARLLAAAFPRRRRWAWSALVAGTAFLVTIPVWFLDRNGPFTYARALLGPTFILWQFFAVPYSACALVGYAVWWSHRRLRGRGPSGSFARAWRRPTLVLLAGFTLAVVVGMYGALVPLRTRAARVEIRGLPRALEGYRIALVSDLHVGPFTRQRRLGDIVEAIHRARPDVVVLAGDLVDDDPGLITPLARGLRHLRARDGVYAMLGNHEIYGGAAAELVRRDDLPFRLLINDAARIERGSAALALVGLGEPTAIEAYPGWDRALARFAPDWERALSHVAPGDFVVAAGHQPLLFEEARARGIPLTLVGHTHGGQLGSHRLRWCLAGAFLPWHMGLYRSGRSTLYVTTGAGHWILPVRLGVPPEVALLELHGAAGPLDPPPLRVGAHAD